MSIAHGSTPEDRQYEPKLCSHADAATDRCKVHGYVTVPSQNRGQLVDCFGGALWGDDDKFDAMEPGGLW